MSKKLFSLLPALYLFTILSCERTEPINQQERVELPGPEGTISINFTPSIALSDLSPQLYLRDGLNFEVFEGGPGVDNARIMDIGPVAGLAYMTERPSSGFHSHTCAAIPGHGYWFCVPHIFPSGKCGYSRGGYRMVVDSYLKSDIGEIIGVAVKYVATPYVKKYSISENRYSIYGCTIELPTDDAEIMIASRYASGTTELDYVIEGKILTINTKNVSESDWIDLYIRLGKDAHLIYLLQNP